MEQRPSNRIEAPGKPGAALVAKLERLRDSHRLGLHMWENDAPYSFPHTSHRTLNEWRAVPEKVNPPQTSVSLLPSKSDGITMQPYGYVSGTFSSAGYLLDLSEDQIAPPTIIAAHTKTMESGENAYAKKYLPEYMAVTLDKLAERYVTDHNPIASSPGVGKFNEVQARIGHEHVAAIVIPSFNDVDHPIEHYDALVTFAGCMNALEHARKGASLPLVSYHVTGAHKGEITYIGEGKKQLETLAARSLKTIMGSDEAFQMMVLDCSATDLIERIENRLGIDINKSVDEQRDAFAKLGVATGSRGRE